MECHSDYGIVKLLDRRGCFTAVQGNMAILDVNPIPRTDKIILKYHHNVMTPHLMSMCSNI
eukprot:3500890-Amphidinium_carterae.2